MDNEKTYCLKEKKLTGNYNYYINGWEKNNYVNMFQLWCKEVYIC